MTLTTTDAEGLTAALGAKLRAAREGRDWSLDEATVQLRVRFPHRKDSRMKIRRMEQGIALDRLDFGLLAALLTLYGIRLGELDPALVEEIEATREVLNHLYPCSGGTPPRGPFALSPAA